MRIRRAILFEGALVSDYSRELEVDYQKLRETLVTDERYQKYDCDWDDSLPELVGFYTDYPAPSDRKEPDDE